MPVKPDGSVPGRLFPEDYKFIEIEDVELQSFSSSSSSIGSNSSVSSSLSSSSELSSSESSESESSSESSSSLSSSSSQSSESFESFSSSLSSSSGSSESLSSSSSSQFSNAWDYEQTFEGLSLNYIDGQDSWTDAVGTDDRAVVTDSDAYLGSQCVNFPITGAYRQSGITRTIPSTDTYTYGTYYFAVKTSDKSRHDHAQTYFRHEAGDFRYYIRFLSDDIELWIGAVKTATLVSDYSSNEWYTIGIEFDCFYGSNGAMRYRVGNENWSAWQGFPDDGDIVNGFNAVTVMTSSWTAGGYNFYFDELSYNNPYGDYFSPSSSSQSSSSLSESSSSSSESSSSESSESASESSSSSSESSYSSSVSSESSSSESSESEQSESSSSSQSSSSLSSVSSSTSSVSESTSVSSISQSSISSESSYSSSESSYSSSMSSESQSQSSSSSGEPTHVYFSDANCQFYARMFNATGTDLYDESGNDYHLTANSDSDGPDQMGDRIRLNKTYHEYYSIDSAYAPNLDITGSSSFSLVGKIALLSDVPAGGWGVMGKHLSGSEEQYGLFLVEDNKLRIEVSNNGISSGYLESNIELELNRAYSFAVVFDNPNNELRIYIDGSFEGSGVCFFSPYDGDANFEIGRMNHDDSTCAHMDIYYMGVFDRVLTR